MVSTSQATYICVGSEHPEQSYRSSNTVVNNEPEEIVRQHNRNYVTGVPLAGTFFLIYSTID